MPNSRTLMHGLKYKMVPESWPKTPRKLRGSVWMEKWEASPFLIVAWEYRDKWYWSFVVRIWSLNHRIFWTWRCLVPVALTTSAATLVAVRLDFITFYTAYPIYVLEVFLTSYSKKGISWDKILIRIWPGTREVNSRRREFWLQDTRSWTGFDIYGKS